MIAQLKHTVLILAGVSLCFLAFLIQHTQLQGLQAKSAELRDQSNRRREETAWLREQLKNLRRSPSQEQLQKEEEELREQAKLLLLIQGRILQARDEVLAEKNRSQDALKLQSRMNDIFSILPPDSQSRRLPEFERSGEWNDTSGAARQGSVKDK